MCICVCVCACVNVCVSVCVCQIVKVGDLWIQEKVEDGELYISKIDGSINPADAMTKNLASWGSNPEAAGQRAACTSEAVFGQSIFPATQISSSGFVVAFVWCMPLIC